MYLYAGDMSIDRRTKTNKEFIRLSLTNNN